MGAIDLHAHLLPGIDDGPPDMEASLALARTASADGTEAIVATPHVSDVYPNRAGDVARGVAAVRDELRAAGVELRVVAGAEIALPQVPQLDDSELAALALGGGPYLLIESPLSSAAGDFELIIDDLLRRGHRLVLAHPERCPAFQRQPDRLRRLAVGGVLCSVTASALTGRFGGRVRDFTLRLFEDQLVHNVASDAHDAEHRSPVLRGCLAAAERDAPGILALEEWLVEEAPAAILAGEPVGFAPPLPRPRRRRRRLSFAGWRSRGG
jgi:protein-tyrosine phosphatase